MSNNLHWTPEDLKKRGLVQDGNGNYVPVSSLTPKKVNKLPNLLERETHLLIPNPIPDFAKPHYERWEQADKTPTANAKIKNATKTVVNGISFDSRLEAYLHGLLTTAGIHFEFQKKFELQAKFRYRDENIRSIYIVFDFWLPERNILIDTKGWQTYDGKMKHKMLKSVLKHLHDMEPEILIPKNQKECDLLLNNLLYGTV